MNCPFCNHELHLTKIPHYGTEEEYQLGCENCEARGVIFRKRRSLNNE